MYWTKLWNLNQNLTPLGQELGLFEVFPMQGKKCISLFAQCHHMHTTTKSIKFDLLPLLLDLRF